MRLRVNDCSLLRRFWNCEFMVRAGDRLFASTRSLSPSHNVVSPPCHTNSRHCRHRHLHGADRRAPRPHRGFNVLRNTMSAAPVAFGVPPESLKERRQPGRRLVVFKRPGKLGVAHRHIIVCRKQKIVARISVRHLLSATSWRTR